MWMCEICVVTDPRNADGNTLPDLTDALRHLGASIEQVDDDLQVIYAIVPADDLMTVQLMEGVAYVRVVCHYFTDREARPALAAAG